MSGATIRIQDSYTLAYPRDLVWRHLNDAAVLASCIRGCRYVVRESRCDFRAVIEARIADFRKDFHIVLTVDETHAPAAYTLSTQMQAGIFGGVDGCAEVRLEQLPIDRTRMSYQAVVSGTRLVGKLLPLVEASARRRVHEFFDRFVEHLDDLPG